MLMIAVIIAAATILPGLKQVRAPSLLTNSLGDDTTGKNMPCNPCDLGAGGIASLGGSGNATTTYGENETANVANTTDTVQ